MPKHFYKGRTRWSPCKWDEYFDNKVNPEHLKKELKEALDEWECRYDEIWWENTYCDCQMCTGMSEEDYTKYTQQVKIKIEDLLK